MTPHRAEHGTTGTSDGPEADTSKRRRIGRAWRIPLWIVAGLVGLVLLSIGASAVLEVRDARRFPAPGDLVELADGRVLHLQVAGDERRGPTVVLDAGQGGFSPIFAWLQAELATDVTVVTYDRPGYGWSDPVDRPVDAEDTAADLHEALADRGLAGPYVLVGHSIGSFYVRTFADRYPAEVVGVVLLDPAHEDQLAHLPERAVAQMERTTSLAAWAVRLSRLGLFRLSNPQEALLADLPERAAAEMEAISATPAYWRTVGAESAAFTALAAAVPADLGEHPVRIVSAPESDPAEADVRAVMDELHRELASRSDRASHLEVTGADHLSLVTTREHAETVGTLVRDLVAEVATR